jgi:thiamine-monophosphate kinase
MAENSCREIVELGEHEIIRIIRSRLTLPKMPVPFGDDVSAVELDGTRVAVLKTDMLVGKTDVPEQMSVYQAARKAIVMNVSDFASKGVQPTAALVALGLPGMFAQKDIEAIAEGLNNGAREYGAYVIGGDTSETSDLIISISLFGCAEKSMLMLRSGAKPDDILAVTGPFGKPPAGLRLMYGDFTAPKDAKELVDSVLLPKARLAEGVALGKSGAVSASMDSSDGLAWSIHEIGRLSNVGFALNLVPIAEEAAQFAKINDLDAEELALYGGEEYEIVLTVKPEKWTAAEEAVAAAGGKLIPIGKATEEKKVVLVSNRKKRTLDARGWEHFKSQL